MAGDMLAPLHLQLEIIQDLSIFEHAQVNVQHAAIFRLKSVADVNVGKRRRSEGAHRLQMAAAAAAAA
jgi:hypothetical protein